MSLKRYRLARLSNKVKKEVIKKRQSTIISPPDNPLLMIIIILMIFGIMAVFSAGAPEGVELHHNPAYFAIKHISFMVLGLFPLLAAIRLDYRNWKDLAVPISIVTIVLIFATYIPGLGHTSNGSSRWLAFLPFQPSELAKLATILLVASFMSEEKHLLTKKVLIKLALVGGMFLLILHQPNLSVSLIIAIITIVLMLIGGVSFSLLAGLSLLFVPVLLSKVSGTGYQMNRITGWLNPWGDPQGTGYNLIQSWYAIGSGGIFGMGFGESKQKLFWLPFRHTDFIFAVIAEELGFVGCLLLIGLFLAFIYRGFLIANRCDNLFGKLVAYGITFSIGIQAFINIGVASGVFPVTGVTLPLVSYGGSSIVITMLMLGILLNISRKRIKRISETGNEHDES